MYMKSEIFKIVHDMDEDKRYREALSTFGDIEDFFTSEFKTLYMTTFITTENMKQILLELEEIFVEHEEYEKCKTIHDWRTKLIKFQ
jgi:hypothetical protein